MSFNFNPSLWFICRLCRRSFASTETLKEHKLACHLRECHGIKCIVFEERLLDTEWNPEHEFCENGNRILNANHENRSSQEECRNTVQFDFIPGGKFTQEELNLTPNKTSSSNDHQGLESPRSEQLLHRSSCSIESSPATDKESEVSKQELEGANRTDDNIEFTKEDNNLNRPQISSSTNDIRLQEEIRVKTEAPIDGVSTSAKPLATEDSYTNFEDVKDGLIVASASASPQFDTVPVKIKMNIYDSDVLGNSSAVWTNDNEPEQQLSESNQHQSSALILNYHSRTATSETIERPFMCETCFAFFRTKDLLNSHLLCHSSIKPFKCSMCPSQFKRKSDLTRHLIVHGKESNFKCRFCDKFFRQNCHLLDHERSHTGDRPFKCPVPTCSYAGHSKSVLAQHTRQKHSEELGLQQFVCPTCGKAFGMKKLLNVHIRRHHNHNHTNQTAFIVPSRDAS